MPVGNLKKRLTEERLRRINWFNSKSLKELHNKRLPLYKKYADVTIDCTQKSNNEIVKEIIKKLK